MSTQGIRDFRPFLHFTAPKMWLNDPNGMVYENGKYHLFYQHHPASTQWGPMHWGHAISTDLIHWQHLPIALYPDELGMIFSGSAVYDQNNTSGFGSLGKAPIVAMYTSHGECEQQSIAYSMDGINFEKYDSNPVITNPGINDFRDPKVFWNKHKDCWSVVLAAKDRVHFYSSPNIRDWTKTGEFGPEGNYANGVWECPDIFPLETEAGEKWVLLVSMGMPKEDGGARTQYFIGNFDGDTFISDNTFDQAEYIDQGFDNYAGVTYQNTEERIFMGWGINACYAGATPTGEFCGIMTLPRKLSLLKTPKNGLRLASVPFNIYSLANNYSPISDGSTLSDQTFCLQVEGSGTSSITLVNADNQELSFGVDRNNNVYVNRTKAGADSFDETFASENYQIRTSPRFYEGKYTLQAIFDVSTLEFFIDEGTRAFSQVIYPDSAYNFIKISGDVSVKLSNINL